MGLLNDLTRPTEPRSDLVGRAHPVKKARAYLKPGQEPPEGSEEQEGPRGGRYYEGEGVGTPSAGAAAPAEGKPSAEVPRLPEEFAQKVLDMRGKDLKNYVQSLSYTDLQHLDNLYADAASFEGDKTTQRQRESVRSLIRQTRYAGTGESPGVPTNPNEWAGKVLNMKPKELRAHVGSLTPGDLEQLDTLFRDKASFSGDKTTVAAVNRTLTVITEEKQRR